MKSNFKRLITFLIVFVFICAFSALTASAHQPNANKSNPKRQMSIKTVVPRYLEQLQMPSKGDEIAVIRTGMGVIKIRLLPQFAPIAVEDFKARVISGYYNNLDFDKIIGNSILQGGSSAQNNPGVNNISTSECNVDARNYRYAVSAAGSDQGGNVGQFTIVGTTPDLIDKDQLNFMSSSGEAQYPKNVIDQYIKSGGAPWLDFHNVVFGQVFEGMGVVDNILSGKVDENNKLKKSVKIKRIDIIDYK